MPDTAPPLDLTQLESDYTVVGELGSTPVSRTVIAERKTADTKRRDDHTGVLITVYQTPEGDESNALSHLAADTKTLASEGHRRLVPVIDGRWLDDDHFAIVTQRLSDPTLAERLASREQFSTIRVAAILRELNGLLDWAREQGIVHRLISTRSVHLEPRTDRVRVMFDVSPLHRVRPAEETRDARTIARLAMAMLAGVEDPEACTVEMLNELRPELPKRLSEATSELLDVKNASTKTNIVNFIALIGMSDPLYRGEEEEKRIRAEILEEQKAEREKLASERTEFETAIAKERTDFAAASTKERTDFQAASTKERADFTAFMEREKAKLESERQSLQKLVADERGKLQKAMEKERSDLTAKRTEMEKAIAAQKAELERAAALDRKNLEELRADLKRRGEAEIERKRQVALEEVEDASETELDDEKLAVPTYAAANLVPLAPLEFNDDTPVLEEKPIEFKPERAEIEEAPERLVTDTEVKVDALKPKKKKGDRPWLIPTAIGGGVAALALIIGVAVSQNRGKGTETTPVATKRTAAVAKPAPQSATPQAHWAVPLPTRTVDSAGGAVAAPVTSAAPRPTNPAAGLIAIPNVDSIAAARAARARAAERQRERERAAEESRAQDDSFFNFRAPVAPPRTDSVAAPRNDSAAAPRRDSVTPVRRDSVTPPDTGRRPRR